MCHNTDRLLTSLPVTALREACIFNIFLHFTHFFELPGVATVCERASFVRFIRATPDSIHARVCVYPQFQPTTVKSREIGYVKWNVDSQHLKYTYCVAHLKIHRGCTGRTCKAEYSYPDVLSESLNVPFATPLLPSLALHQIETSDVVRL